MPVKEITVTIKVAADTPVRLKDKEALLLAFSDLPAEHQQLMTEIMKNPKALKGLSEHKETLLSMIS